MFAGIDEVPWAQIAGACDQPQSVLFLLRKIVEGKSGDAYVWDLRSRLLAGEGKVAEVAPYLIPYLLEVVAVPELPHRALIVNTLTEIVLGESAYPYSSEQAGRSKPDYVAVARAKIVAESDRLIRLLYDKDDSVAAATAQLLAWLPEAAEASVPVLRARVESGAADSNARDTSARDAEAACIIALARLSPDGHRGWFTNMFHQAIHPDVSAAAAVGIALTDWRAEADLPAVRAATDALLDRASAFNRIHWYRYGLNVISTSFQQAERWSRALAREVLSRSGQREDQWGALLAQEAMERWRSAPAELVPLVANKVRTMVIVAPNQEDLDATEQFVEVLGLSGHAVAAHADLLATFLTGDPNYYWPAGTSPAVNALARIGDARCLPWLASAMLEHRGLVGHIDFGHALPGMTAHSDALIPVVETVLRKLDDPGWNPRWDTVRFMQGLCAWKEAAAPLASAVAARMHKHAWLALSVLGAIGPAAMEAEPLVRALLDEDGHDYDEEQELAAWALWRITGEPGRAVEIWTNAIVGDHHATRRIAPLLTQLGPAAASAAPYLRSLLDDIEPDDHRSVGIARTLWAVTGNAAGLIPPLVAAVEKRPLDDEWFGMPPDGLQAIETLGWIGAAAAEAIPALHSIAHGPTRVTAGDVWLDECYQEAARAALSAVQGDKTPKTPYR